MPHPADRPNILWLVTEDMCPDLGCYGHPDGITPHIDRLAERGIRFTNAFSFAPVCAPARTCLITGTYPSSYGGHHRSRMERPEEVRLLTEYLREAGYYCFNGYSREESQDGALSVEGYFSKFDYTVSTPDPFDPLPAWDAVSGIFPAGRAAHWRDRADGQPFFAHVNFLITHSSQYGTRYLPDDPDRLDGMWEELVPLTRVSEEERRDREALRVPAYHPDTRSIRELWGEYHECVTEMDHQVGEILADLERDGLAEDTIVFFFADNGMGVLGGKCWLWDQGIHVPLVVHCPEKWRHLVPGSQPAVDDRMVSFEDFAPTVLNLVGLPTPSQMTGVAFLGSPEAAAHDRDVVIGVRDRIDHCSELIRTVRTRRYQYVRNFLPQIGWDYSAYFWKMAPEMLADWKRLAEAGRLEGRQEVFFRSGKPVEELYDLEADPDEMVNLAEDGDYAMVLAELRTVCFDWMIRTRDLGLLAEHDLHVRCAGNPAYSFSRDPERYPIERILRTADLAGRGNPALVLELVMALADEDPAVRRWAAIGLGIAGHPDADAIAGLTRALGDQSPSTALAAAEALCRLGFPDLGVPAFRAALHHESGLVVFAALEALLHLGDVAREIVPDLADYVFSPAETWLDPAYGWYEPHAVMLIDALLQRFDPSAPRRFMTPLYDDVDFEEMIRKPLGWTGDHGAVGSIR